MVNQTTYMPKETNHLLHLILTLATCGAWLPVWACVALYNATTKNKVRTVVQQPGAWYGPVARPYEVGPGAPVSAMNPHPPVPEVGYPPRPGSGPYVGYGASRSPNNMLRPMGVPKMTEDLEVSECFHPGCTYRTPFGPAMQAHVREPHLAPPTTQ